MSCEGRNEAIASGRQILETKKQPETVHEFTCTYIHTTYTYIHVCALLSLISTSIFPPKIRLPMQWLHPATSTVL